MTVKEINPRILTLEYHQEKDDKDYGSCLWARFMFNLDRYELSITSDCGNYGYKWCETPKSESFLELMVRCDNGYILGKLYGEPDIFSYDKTKESAYEMFVCDDTDKQNMDEIFDNIEAECEPTETIEFVRMFDEYNDDYFEDTFELPAYVYPSDALKIVDIFDTAIRPYINNILLKTESEGK